MHFSINVSAEIADASSTHLRLGSARKTRSRLKKIMKPSGFRKPDEFGWIVGVFCRPEMVELAVSVKVSTSSPGLLASPNHYEIWDQYFSVYFTIHHRERFVVSKV
jgi:hypothetical protein